MKSHAGLSVATFVGFIKLCWLLKLCRRSLPYIGQSLIGLVGSSCPWRLPIPNVSNPNTMIELRIGIALIFSSRVLFRNRPLSITTGTPQRIQKSWSRRGTNPVRGEAGWVSRSASAICGQCRDFETPPSESQSYGRPRGVAYAYDPDRVPRHPVEDLVAIVDHEHDANARPLNDRASAQRQPGNLGHNLLNTGRDTFGNGRIAGAVVIGGDLPDIADGPLRIFDPHARRNTAKAALISSSLAASPASPSSIAVN